MKRIELNVEARTETGSKSMRRLRADGYIPAVIYGGGQEAIALCVSAYDFNVATRKASATQVYTLSGKQESLNERICLIKSVQRNAVTDAIQHVDFYELHKGQNVVVTVPLKLVGESPAVKQKRGIMFQSLYEVDVTCIPSMIPELIELDVSTLDDGMSLHARDIVMPEGVILKMDSDLSVVSVVAQTDDDKPAGDATTATTAGASA